MIYGVKILGILGFKASKVFILAKWGSKIIGFWAPKLPRMK